MHVHEQVLVIANELVAGRSDPVFGVEEIVRALPHLNESSVRTHVVSRCCVNAPKNHLHKWPYFRRVGRGKYSVEAAYLRQPTAERASGRKPVTTAQATRSSSEKEPAPRDTIHAILQRDESVYVAECLEVAVITQGNTLDEVVENLRQALALHLEDEDMAALGLVEHPRLQLTYEMATAS